MKWLMTILGKRKKSKSGFTLIELLFVVIVVAILAAAGVAMYVRSLDKARAAEGLAILSSVRTHYLVERAENDMVPPGIPDSLGLPATTVAGNWGIDTSMNRWWKEGAAAGFTASFNPWVVTTGSNPGNMVTLTGNISPIDGITLSILVETGTIEQVYP